MSFSADSTDRDSIQAIQFELWPDCCTGCKYCYLNGTNRNTTNMTRRDNILDALKTLQDPQIMSQYNAVGLIGGDFFQGQLEGIKEDWIQLICFLNHLMQIKAIKEVWIATSLITEDFSDLLMTLSYFDFNSYDEGQRVTLCTSYDTVGRFVEPENEEIEYSKTFDKNSTEEEIKAFVDSLELSEDAIELIDLPAIEKFFPPVDKIENKGIIFPNGKIIDDDVNTFDNSHLDYYSLTRNRVLMNKFVLFGGIRVESKTLEDGKKVATFYFNKTDMTLMPFQMTQVMNLLKNYDSVEMKTTTPVRKYNELWVEHCNNDLKSAKYWVKNLKSIKEAYPKLSIHTQTILTQDTIEKMIKNPDYFDFITELSSIDFRYPSITRADCPSATAIKDYRSLLMKRYDSFPPKFFIEERATFLKFLKVLHEKYGITKVQNLIHQPEMRSRRLKIYVDNVEITDRWNDDRDVYLECGHLVDGLCYIDTPDKCIYCDVEKYLATVGEGK